MKFLILAGGVGSRLWPLSTKEKPKQFQSFIGEATLLQQAYQRVEWANSENIFVATNQEYQHLVQAQLPQLQERQIILEPAMKDTAPSIAFAMKYLESLFGADETVAIIYADQLIKDQTEFRNKLIFGHQLAQNNDQIIIIEVKAKYPNPNLGYVKIGKLLQNQQEIEVYELDHFTEKPDIATAQKFVDSFKYLWNTGFYIWKIQTFLQAIKFHSPEISNILDQIQDFRNCQTVYNQFPKISLDYALMEKIDPKKVWIIPAELGWSDIGTWRTLHQELPTQNDSNLTEGNLNYLDLKNSIVINKEPHKKIVLVNLEDMVVINTPDALLICNKHEDQKIKDILKKIDTESGLTSTPPYSKSIIPNPSQH